MEAQRKSPADRVVGDICEAEVHPVRQNETEDEECQLDSNQLSSQRRLARLALPHGNGCCIYADSKASNDSSNDHVRKSEGRRLENTSDCQECTAKCHRLAASQYVAKDKTEQSAEDAANGVSRHDLALDRSIGIVECEKKIGVRKKATEDALIIS